jgi:hypothetical protein
MYAALRPRLGVFHFTLAIVFFPFGAPQAQPALARVATATSTTVDAVAPAAVAAPRQIGPCIARHR